MSVNIPSYINAIPLYKPGRAAMEKLNAFPEAQRAFLCSNENMLGPSKRVFEAMHGAQQTVFQYPDALGTELIESLSKFYGIHENQILLGNGSDSLLQIIFRVFTEKGEAFITSNGTFSSIYIQAKQNQVNLQLVPLTTNYEFDLDEILKRANKGARMVYLCSPNNPTGSMIKKNNLYDFMKNINSGVLVVMDEAYYEYGKSLSEDYPESTQWIDEFENLIVLRTFSKAYGLAGLRVGYVLACNRLIEALRRMRLPFEPSIISQKAALAALADQDYLNYVMSINKKFLSGMVKLCSRKNYSLIPSYGNFMLAHFDNSEEAQQQYEFLLDYGILTRKCDAFGLPHCLRISTGAEMEMNVLKHAFPSRNAA